MVKITEIDIYTYTWNEPAQNFDDEIPADDAQRQKDIYEMVAKAYMEVVPPEKRGGFSVWGTNDGESWLRKFRGRNAFPLLFNDDFSEKPALQGVLDGFGANYLEPNAEAL